MKMSMLLTLALLLGTVRPAVAQTAIATKVTDALLAANANDFDEYSIGETAEQQIAKGASYDAEHNVFVVVRHIREEVRPRHAVDSDPLGELKARVANSDAVIVGVPKRRYSALTRTHQFVFSDYEIAVNSIYLDRTSSLVPGAQIVVTRPGGEVKVNGENFRGIEPEFPLFRLDTPYVFFLHLNRTTGVFEVNFSDVYLIQGGQVTEARRRPRMLKDPQSLRSFTSDLEAAIASERKRSK